MEISFIQIKYFRVMSTLLNVVLKQIAEPLRFKYFLWIKNNKNFSFQWKLIGPTNVLSVAVSGRKRMYI